MGDAPGRSVTRPTCTTTTSNGGCQCTASRLLYERISLEAFQTGFSWLTILIKRAAFDNFDLEIVAGYTDDDIERLMYNKAIVRNQVKIEAARANARAVLDLRESGVLDELIWSHKPNETPVPRTVSEVPTTPPLQRHSPRTCGPGASGLLAQPPPTP